MINLLYTFKLQIKTYDIPSLKLLSIFFIEYLEILKRQRRSEQKPTNIDTIQG